MFYVVLYTTWLYSIPALTLTTNRHTVALPSCDVTHAVIDSHSDSYLKRISVPDTCRSRGLVLFNRKSCAAIQRSVIAHVPHVHLHRTTLQYLHSLKTTQSDWLVVGGLHPGHIWGHIRMDDTDLWRCTLRVTLWCCPTGRTGHQQHDLWYPTQSHYTDIEPTSPCPIIKMRSTWLESDKHKFLSNWFDSTMVLNLWVRIRWSTKTGDESSTH